MNVTAQTFVTNRRASGSPRRRVFMLFWLLAFATAAHAQTFSAVLTDPAAKGKEAEQVRATATLTLDAPKETIEFSIVVRPPLVAAQQVSVNLGTPSEPGPAIFVLADGESRILIQGAIHRGAELAQPEDGIDDWEDALTAIAQNKTFLKMETPAYPVGELAGRIRRQ
jgi:hypothetical protein